MPLHKWCEARGEGQPHLHHLKQVDQVALPPALYSQQLVGLPQKWHLSLHKVDASVIESTLPPLVLLWGRETHFVR